MIARACAWALLAGSIGLGTFVDRGPSGGPSPAPEPSYLTLEADLHVHAFPGDGALAPWDVRRAAARRGLDAVAITNHNQLHAPRLDAALFRAPHRLLTIPGIEVTAPRFHLVALGVRAAVDWRLPLDAAIRAVHAQGGVAIAAHPTGRGWREAPDETIRMLDGVEVAHPARERGAESRASIDAVYARARRLNPSVAAIGSSDTHFGPTYGRYRTRLFVTERTVRGALDAIRAGRTTAHGPGGTVYGRARSTADARVSGQPHSGGTAARPIACALAWVSLLALVVLGGSSRTTSM